MAMQLHTGTYSGADNLEVMQEAVNYNRYLLDMVRRHIRPDGRILDFGAGTGQFAIPLQELCGNVTALEPDSAISQHIRARGIPTVGSLADLPPTTFDFIYSLNVLEHIEDDVGVLRELHSVLKPGGTLLIYVPAFQILYTSMDAKVGHLRRYRRHTLARAVRAAGFDIRHMAYVDSLGFFATLAFKLGGNDKGDINRQALRIYDRLLLPLSITLDCVTRRWFGKNLLLVARK